MTTVDALTHLRQRPSGRSALVVGGAVDLQFGQPFEFVFIPALLAAPARLARDDHLEAARDTFDFERAFTRVFAVDQARLRRVGGDAYAATGEVTHVVARCWFALGSGAE